MARSTVGTGLKAACAAATLATCWAGSASAFIIIAPDATLNTNLSVALNNVHMVYGLNFSSLAYADVTNLGSIPTGPTQTAVFLDDNVSADPPAASFPDSLYWAILGTFGTDQVAVSMSPSFASGNVGQSWEDTFFDSEIDIYNALVGGDTTTLENFVSNNVFILLVPFGNDATVGNFSNMTINGPATLLVPEPVSLGLVGVGAMVLLGRRRR